MNITNVLFLIMFTTIFIMLFWNNNILNNNNIQILSKYQTLSVLLSNNDNYYSKFTDTDLKVRKVSNIKEYKEKIKDSVCEPNNMIKNIIIKLINRADIKINKLNHKYHGDFNGIDINKLYNIKWNIGFVCNNTYEDGLPHTRGNVIIMPLKLFNNNNINSIVETLIHEKVHIYQKRFPNETKQYLNNHNFKKIKTIEVGDNIRANPDMDNNIYTDGNIIYKATYLPNANNITDVRLYNKSQKYEHPYESMAISVSDATKIL